MGATSMKELLQQINGEKTSVVQGIVTSANPLKIALVNDTTINIPSDLLIVPEHLTKRTKQIKIVEVNGETESGGSGNTGNGGGGSTQSGGSGNTQSGGAGSTGSGGGGNTQSGGAGSTQRIDQEINGINYWHSHGLDGHTHGLNDHSHSLDGHTHGLNSHTHGLDAHNHTIPSHKHDIKLSNKTVKIEIDDSLTIGEYVHMLSIGQGKIYYILGRVNAKPITT